MRDLSALHTQQKVRGRHWNILAALLAGCLFLLNGCNSFNGTETSRHAGSAVTHRAASVADVSVFLKVQGLMQLEAFQRWVALMQRYKGAADAYQQELTGDQQALRSAKTDSAYQALLQTLEQQVRSIKLPALKTEVASLDRQLTQQVSAWGHSHTYHDEYNNTTYELGYEYGSNGVDGWVQDEMSGARTLADYRQAIEDANMFLTNFQAFKTNSSDKTPWSRVHQTDLQLMQHYKVLNQKVVVISLSEQALRVYRSGQLVKAFQVTTGRPEKPSLPGAWSVESKQAPTVFKSDEPPGSPYWYPDTPINYAMLYHSGGYFLHDSWWRVNYGFGTQFPHVDSSGDSFSFDGSHGCVNISTSDAAWLFNFVNTSTRVIIY